MPLFIIRIFTKNFASLSGKSTTKRFGVLYEDLEMKEGQKLYLQPTFFLIRRLLLCLAVTVTAEYLYAQVIVFTIQSLIAVGILEYVKPYTVH